MLSDSAWCLADWIPLWTSCWEWRSCCGFLDMQLFHVLLLFIKTIYIYIYDYQLVSPCARSKPPLSCLSGFTTLPCKTVYLIIPSQSSGRTLASQMH